MTIDERLESLIELNERLLKCKDELRESPDDDNDLRRSIIDSYQNVFKEIRILIARHKGIIK